MKRRNIKMNIDPNQCGILQSSTSSSTSVAEEVAEAGVSGGDVADENITLSAHELKLKSISNIRNLRTELFPNGLHIKDTIEINGNYESCQHILFMQMIAKFILPLEFDGANCKVVFLNLKYNYSLDLLKVIIINSIKDIDNDISRHVLSSEENIEDLILSCIKNLTVLNIFDNFQITHDLNLLYSILKEEPLTRVLAIDELHLFYNEEKADLSSESTSFSIDCYITNLLKRFQSIAFSNNVIILFKKSNVYDIHGSQINTNIQSVLRNVNFRFTLYTATNEEKESIIHIESATRNLSTSFTIGDSGLIYKL